MTEYSRKTWASFLVAANSKMVWHFGAYLPNSI